MNCVSDIFHNPSFEKDFAFIKELVTSNRKDQDRIWFKVLNSQGRRNTQKQKIRFESHPSSFSGDVENSIISSLVDEEDDEAIYNINVPVKSFKTYRPKEKSSSSSKISLNEIKRKKLRQKLTEHLANGTLGLFEIGEIGDHLKRRDKKIRKTENENSDTTKEVYMNRKEIMSSSSSASSSESNNDENEGEISNVSSAQQKLRNKTEMKMIENKSNHKLDREKKSDTKIRKKVGKKKTSLSVIELQKSRHYMNKCVEVIKEISLALDRGIMPPDGSEDMSRRLNRTKEFASRFSRNYLYPLLRNIAQDNVKNAKNYSIFTGMYQSMYQALQAFLNHLPSTVGTNAFDKLKEHLNCAVEVCEKNASFFEKNQHLDHDDYTKTLKNHCSDLKRKLDDYFRSPSTESLLQSKSTRSTLLPPQQQKGNQRKSVHQRFSMYNTTFAVENDKQWRRMLKNFEARKPKVKSRYRTATFKHRPPVEKQQQPFVTQSLNHRSEDKRSVAFLPNTPICVPPNEDGIQTMIQYENERMTIEDAGEKEPEKQENKDEIIFEDNVQYVEKNDVGKREIESEDILEKLLHLVQNNGQSCPKDSDNNLTNTIVLLQQCLNFKNQNNGPQNIPPKEVSKDDHKIFTKKVSTMVISEDVGKKPRKEPSVTVTGVKNARLICINDENSIVSDVDDSISKPTVPQNSPRRNQIASRVQTCDFKDIHDKEEAYATFSMLRINRIDKPIKPLKLLPKEFAINIIQGKLAYHQFQKGNYMYKKTSTIKPWELMDKISEDILDFALLGIAQEIEDNELLENIYNAEFQY